jgi:polysaccharide export outer membrane protein
MLWSQSTMSDPKLLLLAAVAAACAAGGAAPRTPRYAPGEYRLGVEDLVQVTVWREPDLDVVAPVRPDGRISVPLVGDIEAEGRTARELEQTITTHLADRIASPVVSVVVKELNASRVFVLGEVAKPGAYPLRGAMTVLQALALAGGLTEFASKGGIVLLHPENGRIVRYAVDYDDAVRGAAYELAPGDTVVVP